MIEKDYQTGVFLVLCDAKRCRFTQEYDTYENWHDLLRLIKKDGWKSIKVIDVWKNFCPECSTLIKPQREKQHGEGKTVRRSRSRKSK